MSKAFEPEFKQDDYRIIEEKELYSGYCPVKRYILEYSLFKGGKSHPVPRELVQRPPVTAVLLYDPREMAVILIEQFRIGALTEPLGPWILDVVAGQIEEGETAESCAHREAMEEAGCVIESLIPICHYWVSPGITNERTLIFCGITKAVRTHGVHGLQQDGEDIKVHVIPLEESFALLKSGQISSASAVIALQWLELKLSLKEDGFSNVTQ